MNKKRNRVLWLFILPSLCGFLLFLLLPWGYSLLLTFFKQSGNFGDFIGLQNYSDVLASPSFRLAFFNTIKFMLLAIPLGLAFSLILGLVTLTDKAVGKKQQFLRFFCLLLPMMIPSVSISVVCGEIFAFDGILNKLFHTNIDFLVSEWSFYIMVLIFLWRNVGVMALLICYGYQKIPQEYYENIKLDTQSKWLAFRYISWVHLRPSLFFVLLYAILAVFRTFQDIYLLFGRYPHDSVYMLQHYLNNQFFSLDYAKLCTASFFAAVFIYIINELLRQWERRSEYA